ncbi:unnamed protein product [Periconia digitata]|uniref:Uncharacterized protein n=1 Tax=Periconia digitata TaxID=1303443 RepID=A0A9W4UQ69_9PLEO|nr:unnamed protein product [Periconia digitata]
MVNVFIHLHMRTFPVPSPRPELPRNFPEQADHVSRAHNVSVTPAYCGPGPLWIHREPYLASPRAGPSVFVGCWSGSLRACAFKRRDVPSSNPPPRDHPHAAEKRGQAQPDRPAMDVYRKSSASTMNSTSENTGIRKTLRRWKDRWRLSSYSSKSSLRSVSSSSRPPSNNSSAAPAPTSHPSRLSPVPASPLPLTDALFTPTTQTYIHSPADPRSRSRTGSTSSPAATLRKSPPLSRRNTTPTEHLHGLVPSHRSPSPGGDSLPMNTVTTTIVAGNDSLHKKRSSRFRLSISKSRSGPSPALNSPSSASFFDRSSSRATGRFDAVEETVGLGSRKRADTKVSEQDRLLEETGRPAQEAETPKAETTDETQKQEKQQASETVEVETPEKPATPAQAHVEKPETVETPNSNSEGPDTKPNSEVESASSPDVKRAGASNTIRVVEVGA